MNDIDEKILPPAFMATTRQKILLKDQVQEYALDYYQMSPIVSMFTTIGNVAINIIESFKQH